MTSEDAKDFEVEVHGKIAEINKVQAYLDTIKMNLEEEERLICALEESLKMKRSLKYNRIAEQLHILISEYILDSGGKKNDKYMEAIAMFKKLSQVKQLCKNEKGNHATIKKTKK